MTKSDIFQCIKLVYILLSIAVLVAVAIFGGPT